MIRALPHDGVDCIFHIGTATDVAVASANGEHRPPSLESEGFIHLSQAHQVRAVLQAFYPGRTDLVLMLVDPALLSSPLRFEAPASLRTPGGPAAFERNQLFPHLYGPLNAEAIVGVVQAADFDGLPVQAGGLAAKARSALVAPALRMAGTPKG